MFEKDKMIAECHIGFEKLLKHILSFSAKKLLSHPNAWPLGSKAVNNSAMVIQENTPSSHS